MNRSILPLALGAFALTSLTTQATLSLSSDYIPSRAVNKPVTISAGQLLSNDYTDQEESEGITILDVGGAQYGTVTLTGGVITYSPGRSFPGQDGFWYTATDGFDTQSTYVNLVNPFFTSAGVYGAPIADYSIYPQTHESSGYIRVNVDRTGSFTSKLVVAGYAYAIKGVLPLDEPFFAVAQGKGKPTVQVQISAPQYFVGSLYGQASYTIDGTTYNGSFQTGENVLQIFDSDLVGLYTAAFQSEEEYGYEPNASGLQGLAGFTSIRINARGQATMVGKLADGTPFSSCTFVQSGELLPPGASSNNLPQPEGEEIIPVYSPIYSGKGSVIGSLYVSTSVNEFNIPTAQFHLVQGPATWFMRKPKTAEPASGLNMGILGSTFVAPRKGQPFFETISNNGAIEFLANGGNLSYPVYASGLLGANPLSGPFAAIFNSDKAAPQMKVSTMNGTFTGTFSDPETRARYHYTGVLLTLPFYGEMPFGVGCFSSGKQMGQVTVQAYYEY